MSGGLIALTESECRRILHWFWYTQLGADADQIGPDDVALKDRLVEWKSRHSTEVHVRGD